MSSTAPLRYLPTQFDAFLYASLRDDGGERLSVLSALARLDLDPWAAASDLARLPQDAAEMRFAILLAGLPEVDVPALAVPDTVARLIKLLPLGSGTLQIGVNHESSRRPWIQTGIFELAMATVVVWMVLSLLNSRDQDHQVLTPKPAIAAVIHPPH